MSSITSSTGQTQIDPVEEIIAHMKESGFTDEEIKAIQEHDKTGATPDLNYFAAIDRRTLSSLQYFGNLDENTKELIHAQAPISLLRTIGDINNWKNGSYIGFGADFVENFLQQEIDDIDNITLDAISLAILISRAKILQTRVEQQLKYIESVNAELSEINTMISRASSLKAEAGDDHNAMPQDMIDFWNKYNAQIAGDDHEHHGAEWDANIRSLKTVADKISTQSNIETTKLQQDINKFNQAFELLNSMLKKFEDSSKTTARH